MRFLLPLLVLVFLCGCSNSTEPMPEPAHITVQHVLVGFEGTVPGKNITRTKQGAEALVSIVLAEANAGVDFGSLVQQYTDDQYPGIYRMANLGIAPVNDDPSAGHEYGRDQLVRAFGDIAFRLRVGEVGVAAYDPRTSPYGFHVIKRLE